MPLGVNAIALAEKLRTQEDQILELVSCSLGPIMHIFLHSQANFGQCFHLQGGLGEHDARDDSDWVQQR